LIDDANTEELRQAIDDSTFLHSDQVKKVDYVDHVNGAAIITLK